MSTTTCPACDNDSFDLESQTCTNCRYGYDLTEQEILLFVDTDYTIDESAGVNPDHPLNNEERIEMSENASEQPQAENEAKVYPGKLDEWNRLKEEAATATTPELKASYEIAALLAGISYHLDGIRFGVRAK